MSTKVNRRRDDVAAGSIGRRIKEARERAGLSQRQLAFPGCSPAYISRIEAGDRTPSVRLLRELARRLGVSEDYLARGSDAEPETAVLGGMSELEIAVRFDDVERAQQLIEETLDRSDDPRTRADALTWGGQLALRQGDPQRARHLLEQALHASPGDDVEQPAVCDSLGRAYIALGEDELAIDLFERSLGRAEERDDLIELIRFSILLANALIDAGNLGRAEEILGRALARTHGLDDPTVRARLYWSQSRLHAGRTDSATAARYARKAIALIELTEDQSYAAGAYHLLAHVELDRGRAEEGLALLQQGLDLLAGAANPLVRAKFRIEEARALVQLGRGDEAAEIAMEAAGLLTETNPVEAGRSYQMIAESLEDAGDTTRARELYELALELLEARANRYLVAAYARFGELLEREGDKDAALEIFKRAVQVQARLGSASIAS